MSDAQNSNLPSAAPLQLTDGIYISRAGQSLAATLRDLVDDITSRGTNVVIVDYGGDGDFETVTEAATFVAVQVPTAATPWAILVRPGVYIEDDISIPSFTSVTGQGGALACIVQATEAGAAAGNNIFNLATSTSVFGIAAEKAQLGAAFEFTGEVGAAVQCLATDCLFGYRKQTTGFATIQGSTCRRAEVTTDRFPTAGTDVAFANLASGELDINGGRCETATTSANKLWRGYQNSIGTSVMVACTGSSCQQGVVSDSDSFTQFLSSVLDKCDVSYYIPADGTNPTIYFVGSTITNSVEWDWDAANASARVVGSGITRRDKIRMGDDVDIVAYYLSEETGDEALIVHAELAVGNVGQGRESIFGEGDSYAIGQSTWTSTAGGVFEDVTAAAVSSTDSTFTFPGVAVGNAIYIASTLTAGETGDLHKFQGIKAATTVAADVGGGEIVAEYWDGSTWVEFTHMSVKSGTPYTSYADTLFGRVQSEQVYFDRRLAGAGFGWSKSDPMAQGTDRYWMRFRIATTITTAPVFEQIKLHTCRTEINEDGYVTYYGNARPVGKLPLDSGTAQAANDSPGNQDLYVSDTLGVGRIENAFGAGATEKQCLVYPLSPDLDTSTPIRFRFSYMGESNTAGQTTWQLNWVKTVDGDSIYNAGYPATAPGEKQLQFVDVLPTGQDNLQRSVQLDLDVSDFAPTNGDNPLLWVALTRLSAGNTYPADMNLIQYNPMYLKWNNGDHAEHIYD